MPRVSVLLPCRNAAAFLRACIASLQAQTFSDFEVVSVDDASSDETASLLASTTRQDQRFRFLNAEGQGIVDALNTGLRYCTSEFVARLDADDIAHPQRLEKQIELFDVEPELAACGTRVRYFPREHVRDGALRYESWLNSLSEPAEIERDIFVECPIAHPTLMIRTAVMNHAGGYRDTRWPEDYDLILRLFMAGKRMRNVPEILHEWREYPDRLSRKDSRYSDEAFRACKAHHLTKMLVADERAFVICGAGPIGRHFAELLQHEKKQVAGFVDVDPKKAGRMIDGFPVWPVEELPALAGEHFILAAVSGSEPRAQIRALLAQHGCTELEDFVAVA